MTGRLRYPRFYQTCRGPSQVLPVTLDKIFTTAKADRHIYRTSSAASLSRPSPEEHQSLPQ